MLKIGLTGGIGSGKSTVANIFKVLGIPVFDADTVAKDLMENNLVIREKLTNHFGPLVFDNGKLNRKWLANIVFKNPYELNILNAIVHPITLNAATDWFLKQEAPYVIKEAALLFEAGAGVGLDFVIGIFAPQNIRIQRVMQRDGLSRNEVLERIDRQLSDTIKMKLCDFVIVNDDQQMLTQQVLDLHNKFIGL
jgi:dephospho-CoA kinase